jgi:hypothetical protein
VYKEDYAVMWNKILTRTHKSFVIVDRSEERHSIEHTCILEVLFLMSEEEGNQTWLAENVKDDFEGFYIGFSIEE